MKKISVLIPTYNPGSEIKKLLDRLLSQVLKGIELEIIIVDSSSTDNTPNLIADNYPSVNFISIRNDDFDHGGTRNLLASVAQGDYLLFMTQDAIPVDDYLLKNLSFPLKDEMCLISFARQIPKEDASPLEQFARSYNYPPQSIEKKKELLPKLGIKTFFNSNVCSMYKREVFEKFDGFPEKIILNEDMILSSNVILQGYSVMYASDAKVFHSHNYKLKQQFKRYFDIGMAFHDTEFLLKYASNEKEGFKMIKSQFGSLWKDKKIGYIIIAVFENLAKFSGYYMGKKHYLFPQKLKRALSAYMK
ncbi:glycosyltransferase family 2 protein [Terribacillus halophilus]|uniref:glycosyltransferase family 2 protein n=1 Tax=Terribacillus halophilus TaxID=361279 RepID=UPI0009876A1B|nr:glycosyltransferase [Terribacillus halophilus]